MVKRQAFAITFGSSSLMLICFSSTAIGIFDLDAYLTPRQLIDLSPSL